MKKQNFRNLRAVVAAAMAGIVLGWTGLNLGGVVQAQTAVSAPQPPPDLPPALKEVVKLARAGLSEEVILAKIKNDGAGNLNCETPTLINLWGHVECSSNDQATVKVELVYWLGKQDPASPEKIDGTQCSLPPPPPGTQGCYLHAVTSIGQCQ